MDALKTRRLDLNQFQLSLTESVSSLHFPLARLRLIGVAWWSRTTRSLSRGRFTVCTATIYGLMPHCLEETGGIEPLPIAEQHLFSRQVVRHCTPESKILLQLNTAFDARTKKSSCGIIRFTSDQPSAYSVLMCYKTWHGTEDSNPFE